MIKRAIINLICQFSLSSHDCTHHLEGLGDSRGEHANTEEDEKSGAEADCGDHADTEGLASLQMTVKTNDDSLSDLTSVAAAREANTLSGHLSSGLLAPAA